MHPSEPLGCTRSRSGVRSRGEWITTRNDLEPPETPGQMDRLPYKQDVGGSKPSAPTGAR